MTTTTPRAEAATSVDEGFARGRDGTRLYYKRRRGPRPLAVVLCDGIACDGFIYKYLEPALQRSVTTVHWNYRGHGRSGSPNERHRIRVEDFADDLNAVRDAVGDPEVVLVGHSFGVQVSLEAYARRPAGVRAIVCLCGSAGHVTHTFKGTDLLASVLPGLSSWAEGHQRVAQTLWSWMPTPLAVQVARVSGDVDATTVDPEDVAPYFRHARHMDVALFLRMLAVAGEHSAEPLLPTVRVPALVVAGERDSFTPATLSRGLADGMPDAELTVIPGATHAAPLEHHELVALRIEKFLEERRLLADAAADPEPA